MKPVLPSLLVLAFFVQPSWLLAQDGKLQQVRDDVRAKKDNGSSSDKKKDHSESSADDDDDNPFGEIIGDALIGVCWLCCEGVFGLPRQALGDADADGYFLSRPYAHGQPGLMWLKQSMDEDLPAFHLRHWSGQLFVEESNDFRGINRVNGDLRLDSLSRFGVQAAWSYLTERLDQGGHDELFLGDANVTYRFAQSEQMQMHTGVGFRWLADRCGSDYGFNFTYGADLFPVKPLVFTASIDLGSLGSAFVFHARATAGAVFKHLELFTGYDFLRIGSVNLQGPVLGLRYWF